jgi:alpha-L-fucosidase
MNTRFEPEWESLNQYEVPAWYCDAKFGLFAHWGVYSVPAYRTEWYPRYMYWHEDAMRSPGSAAGDTMAVEAKIHYRRELLHHHEKTWGPLSEFGYKDFIPYFEGERFDADHWMDVAKKAGARYFVTIAEHHDGFAMYDCDYTKWNAVNMGPKRDVVQEVRESCRRNGLYFGVSSHRAWNWFYYHYQEGFDTVDPACEGLYGRPHPLGAPPDKAFTDDWFARTKEVLTKYEPDILWFDWCWEHDAYDPYREDLLSWYYNRGAEQGREVVLNTKGKVPPKAAVLNVERGVLDDIRYPHWQTDTSISHISWCHVVNDHYKNAARLIYDLLDIVSKNGNLLLNVGPRADGTIPTEVVGILAEMGEWLSLNGEAIYETTPWVQYGEHSEETARLKKSGGYSEAERVSYTSEDIRFTCRGDTLYATFLDWPGKSGTIRSLGTGEKRFERDVKQVTMLASGQSLEWVRDDRGLHINMPETRPCDHAFTVKISPI